MTNKIIAVIGGFGFIGKALLPKLLSKNYKVKIVSRSCHNLDQQFYQRSNAVEFVSCDISDITSLSKVITGCYGVINLVGLLFEQRPGDFIKIHAEAAKHLAILVKQLKIEKLIHISALGIDRALTSKYAQTKLAGESALSQNFEQATIVRPSIVFGAEDNFFNQFARMAKLSPFLPLIGGGDTKFQPIYVNDLADALVKILDDNQFCGKTFELTGPQIITFKEIIKFILKTIDKKRVLLPIPFELAKILGKLANFLPTPPLTSDQVELLKYDNINSNNYLTLNDLNIVPNFVEEIVPPYLQKYK